MSNLSLVFSLTDSEKSVDTIESLIKVLTVFEDGKNDRNYRKMLSKKVYRLFNGIKDVDNERNDEWDDLVDSIMDKIQNGKCSKEEIEALFKVEEVKSTKEISPAPAPASSKSTITKKEIVAIVEEKKEVAKKIATEKEIDKMNKKQERIANTKAAKSGEEVTVDLRNCKSVTAMKKAFKEAFYGINTEFLNILTYFELEVLRFQGNEISIDHTGGCEGMRYNLSFGKHY